MEIQVREPKPGAEMERYYDLRWRVLREPWTCARESGTDEHEREAIHLTAWMGGRLVGAGRLHLNSSAEAQIRYMAVEPDCAGSGIGSRILRELEERAHNLGAVRVVLNARDTALGFYRKHGYRLVDKSGVLFGSIVHWRMEKDL
jgi:N-acetylglutamate synthase-like GNAT family acetyltransferase